MPKSWLDQHLILIRRAEYVPSWFLTEKLSLHSWLPHGYQNLVTRNNSPWKLLENYFRTHPFNNSVNSSSLGAGDKQECLWLINPLYLWTKSNYQWAAYLNLNHIALALCRTSTGTTWTWTEKQYKKQSPKTHYCIYHWDFPSRPPQNQWPPLWRAVQEISLRPNSQKSCASLEQHVSDFIDTVNLHGGLYFPLCFALGNSEPYIEPTFRNFLVYRLTLPLVWFYDSSLISSLP